MDVETRADAGSSGELLRRVDVGLWVAEVPLRRVLDPGRRMSVVGLSSGELLVHSPAPLTERLRCELDRLGEVRRVIAPSKFHGNLFMEQYQAAYPRARFYGPPGLARRRPDVRFAGELGDEPDQCWGDDLDQARICGQRFSEVVFLHRSTRTLIIGDCFAALGPQTPALLWRWCGARAVNRRNLAPGEHACRVLVPWRVAIRDRDSMRRSLSRVLAWDFDRVITGHGEMVQADGHGALRAAYRWLLEDNGRRGRDGE